MDYQREVHYNCDGEANAGPDGLGFSFVRDRAASEAEAVQEECFE